MFVRSEAKLSFTIFCKLKGRCGLVVFTSVGQLGGLGSNPETQMGSKIQIKM